MALVARNGRFQTVELDNGGEAVIPLIKEQRRHCCRLCQTRENFEAAGYLVLLTSAN